MARLRLRIFAAASLMFAASAQAGTESAPIPAAAIVVKGAWSSATGSPGALPEGGAVSRNRYDNAYFGVSYTFNDGWTQRYEGPPPSDSGYYVLAQIEPQDVRNAQRGHFLIAAQDLFFTTSSARNAAEFIDQLRNRLGEDYRVEQTGKVHMTGYEFERL